MKPTLVFALLLASALFVLGCVTPSPSPTARATATVDTVPSDIPPFPTDDDLPPDVSGLPTDEPTASATGTTTATPSPSSTPAPTPSVTQIEVRASDYGFRPSSANATKGSRVQLLIYVDDQDVYYGGLQVKCQDIGYDSRTIQPGGKANVTFTLTQSVLCSAYWPASGVKKGNFNIQAT